MPSGKLKLKDLNPNIGFKGTKERMTTQWDSQIAGAVGAALFGYSLCRQGESKREKEH
jgi:hypothetical protein